MKQMAETSREWWMLGPDRKPVGPMSTERVLEGLEEGVVLADALVCEVGATEWRAVQDVSVFQRALSEMEPPAPPKAARRHPDGPEATMVDPPTIPPAKGDAPTQKFALSQFDDVAEKTVVEDAPSWSERP